MYTVALPIVGRLDLDGQNFAPIGLHKTDIASDWLLLKRHCTGLANLKWLTASTYIHIRKACQESSYKKIR